MSRCDLTAGPIVVEPDDPHLVIGPRALAESDVPRALANLRASSLGSVRSVDLDGTFLDRENPSDFVPQTWPLGDELLDALAVHALPQLERLDASCTSISDAGIAAICATAWPLRELDLSMSEITPAGARRLAAWPGYAGLRSLHVNGFRRGLEVVAGLAAPDSRPALRLTLSDFGVDGIRLLGADDRFDLERSDLGEGRMRAVLAHPCPFPDGVARLDSAKLDDRAIEALVDSPPGGRVAAPSPAG